ncbi:ATP-binding cassette sub-family C member 9-like [Ptychodera flava]|uniref:ATP-binding cassette sub-family C member 9-like n=1 Tax=Ptychodera flava TaxID=63121 RepID=UPI00396A72C2
MIDKSATCRYNQQILDTIYGVVHVCFLFLLSLVLIGFRCFSTKREYSSKTLIPYPGHKRKWILSTLLILVLLCGVGEGVLTDLSWTSVTQPHLYVPQSCALLCGLISLMYYNYLEYWNRPQLTWLLVLYWLSAIAIDSVRLTQQIDETGFDLSIMRLDIIFVSIVIYSCLLMLEFNVLRTQVFHCWYTEKDCPADLKKEKLFYHYKYNSLLQRVLFNAMNWLFVLGCKRPLEISDLGCVPEDLECKNVYKVFDDAYSAEQERALKTNSVPSLWRAYLRAYGLNIAVGVTIKALADFCTISFPLIIGGIVRYSALWYYDEAKRAGNVCYVTVNEFFNNGFVLAACLSSVIIARAAFLQYGNNICERCGLQAKTAFQAYTYEKSLHLPMSALSSSDMTAGQVTNYMSVDAMAIQWFTQYQAGLWPMPFLVVAILALLYMEIGVSALIGASFFIIFLPIQFMISDKFAKIQAEVLKKSDTRMKKINETLQSMKLVKLYGWEDMLFKAIDAVRGEQVQSLIKLGTCMSAILSLSLIATAIVSLLAFLSYSFLSPEPLTPDKAFVALAFFYQLYLPLVIFAQSLRYTADAVPSMRRLQQFFDYKEAGSHENGLPAQNRGFQDIDLDEEDSSDNESKALHQTEPSKSGKDANEMKKTNEETDKFLLLNSDDHEDYGSFQEKNSFLIENKCFLPDTTAFKVTDGIFSWNYDGSSPVLSNINLIVPCGSLVIVIGLVGSGKSSLISAILGEMTTVSGSVQFNRKRNRISYVPQKAWLQNASLRDNILFGQIYDKDRYDAAIQACALQPDIDILPAGDMTEIGERGINLSGGQKQRVSVARAIYSNTDIVILDDPLSALDVHVSSHLLENGIMDLLVRQGRTVMLVTHQLQSLQFAHKVVLLDNGKIVREGDLNEIKKHDWELFVAWEKTLRTLSESDRETDTEDERILSTEEERLQLAKDVSKKEKREHELRKGSVGTLIEDEERLTGAVSWRVYRTYAKAIKYPLVVLTLLLLAAQVGALMASNFWLSAWSEAGLKTINKTQEEIEGESMYYRRGYTVLTLTFVVFLMAAVFVQVVTSLFAAKRIHFALLRNVIHAPMRFFDTTPVGRILNRFSSDTQIIDQKLWWSFLNVEITASTCLSALIAITIVTPVFLILVAPFVVVYYFIQKYYVTTSRELQRIDSITKSPVFAHFSETLGGLTVIRAYRDENRFRKRLLEIVDINNVTQLYLLCGFRWLSIRLELVGAILAFISALTSLISCIVGAIPPSWVGLAVTYAISICGQVSWMVRMFAECEMNMNAVERVNHYTKLKTEEYIGTYNPPPSWPDKGNIQFEDVSVRYADDLEPVLKDINVHFKAGKKIGICGRTGSGKSSLTLALFRMIETFKGRIIIDGIDISQVPLLTLRTGLAIIPQDPVLFSGTIRFNLDPEYEKMDAELWAALGVAQLHEVVADLPEQLEADMSEAGENFSVGQRQLFCLARAFLRNSQILVMDEATSSIDVKTDAILQHVISTAFANRTVLTIAHRMSTILDSDNVLVLNEGRVVEFGSPEKLEKQDGSHFAALVKGHY